MTERSSTPWDAAEAEMRAAGVTDSLLISQVRGAIQAAISARSETASRLPPEANELARMAANDRRYRRLKDAAGRTWDKLAGAHLMGQLDSAIDHLGEDE